MKLLPFIHRVVVETTAACGALLVKARRDAWSRQADIVDLEPGQQLVARVAAGRKGLTAVELRLV